MEIQGDLVVGIFSYCDRWCEACAFTARCRVFAEAQLDAAEPEIRPEHALIEARAKSYSMRTFEWLRPRNDPHKRHSDPHSAFDTIGFFAFFIAAQVHRSAKIALEAIDRSRAAWLAMSETGVATRDEAAPFLIDLLWLRDALDRASSGLTS